jgi:hypothetical protein
MREDGVRWMPVTLVTLALAGLLSSASVPSAFCDSLGQGAKWKAFVNKAGWSISYPPHWQIGSCHQCSDPTEAQVFVTFFEPSTKTLVMIEPLAEKPSGQDADSWLKEVSRDTVLNPRISEDWIVLGHRRALKVVNGNLNSSSSENIYVMNGGRTFAIRTSRDTPSYPTYLRMLSTFKVTAAK